MNMSAAGEPAALDVRDFFSLLWRRRWMIAAVVAAVVAAAVAFSLLKTPVYISKASVLVEAPPGTGGIQTGPNMATEKLVASSYEVADRMARRLKLREGPRDLLGNLSVDVPVETEVLDFTYAAPSPETARERAQAFAEAYLAFHRQKLSQETSAARTSALSQISGLNRELQKIQQRLDGADGSVSPAERNRLQSQATFIGSQMLSLQTRLNELDSRDSASPGQIVEPAALPNRPSSPNYPLNAMLGVVVGLMLAVGVVVAREFLGDRIQGKRDLESQVGAPVLGAIPTVRTRGPITERLVTKNRPNSLAAEAFRQLRANFVIAAGSSDAKTILVTSAGEQEGKTFAAANLGVMLAKAGMNVVLLSADLRRPELERLFGFSPPAELAGFLREGVEPPPEPEASWMWSIQFNLMLMSLGTASDNSAELLGSSTMAAFIKKLRDSADFVLIDAAPLLAVADAATMAPACDAVLIVADANSAARKSMMEARQQLERIHAPVVGAVLVNAPVNGLRPYRRH
jgi:capsular exopolysaccharide synthesis family protein